MTPRPLEIAMPFLIDRHFPASAARELAAAYEASGVVDYLQAWDQLSVPPGEAPGLPRILVPGRCLLPLDLSGKPGVARTGCEVW